MGILTKCVRVATNLSVLLQKKLISTENNLILIIESINFTAKSTSSVLDQAVMRTAVSIGYKLL